MNDPTYNDDRVYWLPEIIESLPEENRQPFGIGMKNFDRAMQGGFRGEDLVIVAGRSGEGKTTLAQTWTVNLVKRAVPCLWFTYELSVTNLDRKFREMGLNSDTYLVAAPAYNTTGKLEWVKLKIREAKEKYMTQVIFIDHIDFLVPSDVKTTDNQSIALKKIATELKTLAIQENVAIVCMAHVRKTESAKELEMSDIGYSAGIFQLADYVFMINREEEEQKRTSILQKNSGQVFKNEAKVKLVKNRLTGETVYQYVHHTAGKFWEKGK